MRILYFLISASILLLDQLTKYLIIKFIPPLGYVEVLPMLNIVNVRNRGAAFGMFQNLGNTVFIIISLAAVIVMVIFIIKGAGDFIAFSLLLGGAAGNLTDRFLRGSVVDFIDVYAGKYHWPAFNVADSALTTGVFLLIISQIRDTSKKPEA